MVIAANFAVVDLRWNLAPDVCVLKLADDAVDMNVASCSCDLPKHVHYIVSFRGLEPCRRKGPL